MYDIKEKLQGECMRKWLLCAGLVLCLWILCGCSIRKVDDTQKRKAVYENVQREEIPEECKKWIEEKKQEPFTLTYEDQGSLYLFRGYGRKKQDGYRVKVVKIEETSNTIFFQTELVGPKRGSVRKKKETYPYCVVKMKAGGKMVVFE